MAKVILLFICFLSDNYTFLVSGLEACCVLCNVWKRIIMSQSKITPTFFKPTSDVGIKKLFGSSGNEALLIQLLNSIIDDKVITEVEILNPVHAVNVETTATFDLYCRCNDGARVIVEMQNVGSGRHQFPDRALAYSALSILDQWHVKQQYKSDK